MNHKWIVAVLCITLCAVIVFGIVTLGVYQSKTDALNNQIVQLDAELSGRISSLEARLYAMEGNIQTMLDKQSSIIANCEVSYGKPDADTLTGKVTVKVTPKEYDETTQATLFIGDKSDIMLQTGNSFIGTVPVDISDICTVSVTFNSSGINRSEALPDIVSYGDQLRNCLQIPSTSINGESNGDGYIYGTVAYQFDSPLGEAVAAAKIVAMYHGNEVWSQTLPGSGNAENSDTIYPVGRELTEVNAYGEGYESYETYVEVTGSYGFIYRYWVDGTDKQAVYDHNGNEIIFE